MKKVLFFLFALIVSSCGNDDLNEQISLESIVVVEGSIEEGEFAQVLLSSTIPVTNVIDSTNILDHVIRSAKITISDGLTSEVLRVKNDKNRIPPFVYFGSTLKGEAGKEYSLKIEYLKYVFTAVTTIPKTVPLISAKYVKENPADTTGYVFVEFDDPVNEKNYYQIATKVNDVEPVYVPVFYGNLDDKDFKVSSVSMQINRGILIFPKTDYIPFFYRWRFDLCKIKNSKQRCFGFLE
jgi:hypothetical protein